MARTAKPAKPRKPYPAFPLTAHTNGRWCKKIRGKVRFFGVWADPQAALERYLRAAADLRAGRRPRQTTLPGEEVTVKDLCNRYLSYQTRQSRSRGNRVPLVRGLPMRSVGICPTFGR